jgi:hypothetical protein
LCTFNDTELAAFALAKPSGETTAKTSEADHQPVTVFSARKVIEPAATRKAALNTRSQGFWQIDECHDRSLH